MAHVEVRSGGVLRPCEGVEHPALRRSLPARSTKDTLPNLVMDTPSRTACQGLTPVHFWAERNQFGGIHWVIL